MTTIAGLKRTLDHDSAAGSVKRSRIDEDNVSDASSDHAVDHDFSDDEAVSRRSTPRTSTQPSTPMSQSKPREKKHVCNFPGCGKAYTRPVRLAEHQRSHTNERPFACSHDGCDKTFLRESHLKHHLKAKHEDVRDYVCDFEGCGKGFHTGQRLKMHQKLHTADKDDFRCTEFPPCNQQFRKVETLERHIQLVHRQEKPFGCDHIDTITSEPCGLRFKTSTQLIAHKDREHSGNRFWCKMCSPQMTEIDPRLNLNAFTTAVGFPTYAEMQQHIKLIHPPICSQCNKICASNSDLKAHTDIHHGDINARRNFSCDHPGCDRAFTRKGNLDVHKKTVHAKQKQFVCGEFATKPSKRLPEWDGHGACGRAFATKANLEGHIRTQHLRLPEYVRPGRKVKQEARSQRSAVELLTGYNYDQSRNIACVEHRCLHRFVKTYDLERHLQGSHGYSAIEAIVAVAEREALEGGDFWFGGQGQQQVDAEADAELAFQLGKALGGDEGGYGLSGGVSGMDEMV